MFFSPMSVLIFYFLFNQWWQITMASYMTEQHTEMVNTFVVQMFYGKCGAPSKLSQKRLVDKFETIGSKYRQSPWNCTGELETVIFLSFTKTWLFVNFNSAISVHLQHQASQPTRSSKLTIDNIICWLIGLDYGAYGKEKQNNCWVLQNDAEFYKFKLNNMNVVDMWL